MTLDYEGSLPNAVATLVQSGWTKENARIDLAAGIREGWIPVARREPVGNILSGAAHFPQIGRNAVLDFDRSAVPAACIGCACDGECRAAPPGDDPALWTEIRVTSFGLAELLKRKNSHTDWAISQFRYPTSDGYDPFWTLLYAIKHIFYNKFLPEDWRDRLGAASNASFLDIVLQSPVSTPITKQPWNRLYAGWYGAVSDLHFALKTGAVKAIGFRRANGALASREVWIRPTFWVFGTLDVFHDGAGCEVSGERWQHIQLDANDVVATWPIRGRPETEAGAAAEIQGRLPVAEAALPDPSGLTRLPAFLRVFVADHQRQGKRPTIAAASKAANKENPEWSRRRVRKWIDTPGNWPWPITKGRPRKNSPENAPDKSPENAPE